MANQWKINTANSVNVDLGPYDIYNQAATFELYYKKSGDANTTNSNATWTEVTHDIASPITFSTNGITAASSATIAFDGALGGTVEAGQVYEAAGTFIYVSSATVDTITLRRLTTAEIPDNTAFTQVGNTGIYETDLTLAALGQYVLLISNPAIGLLNEATKVEVVTNTLDDVAGQIATNDTSVDTQLSDIQSALGIVDTSITGKLII